MNLLDIAKAHVVGGGIALLSGATCRGKGLLPRVLAASAAACMLLAGLAVTSARAQDARQSGAMGSEMVGTMSGSGYMPPGIMVGQAGEWMLGYQFMLDSMAGNLVGTKRISNEKILERFATTPTDMKMRMHMFMAMYAPSNDFTLMAMLPYIRKSMNHVSSMGAPFIERTEGLGDLELRGLYTVYGSAGRPHRIQLTAGVGLPSGSIDKSMEGMRLEYPMQLGSGTVSLLPGVIYLGTAAPWNWGAELGSNVRLGENANGYRLGNRYRLSVWGARQLTNLLTVVARADGERWGNIRGADPLLDHMDEPTKDPTLQAGKRLDLLLGVSVRSTEGFLKGQQFFLEAGAPVYQSLDGPQLKRSWVARAAWQWSY